MKKDKPALNDYYGSWFDVAASLAETNHELTAMGIDAHRVYTWADDEAQAYRLYRFSEGRVALERVRIAKLATNIDIGISDKMEILAELVENASTVEEAAEIIRRQSRILKERRPMQLVEKLVKEEEEWDSQL